MSISVIIISRDEGDNLHKTISSVIESEPNAGLELIVVDDGSRDGSGYKAVQAFPHIRLLRNDSSEGVSLSRRRGAEASRGSVLVFLDAHVKLQLRAITRLAEGVDRFCNQAILVPKIVALDTAHWEFDDRHQGYGYELRLETFRTRWLPLRSAREIADKRYYESPALAGGALAIHRDLYAKVNGFDGLMRGWGVEDIDMGVRCWMLGHIIVCDAATVIGHRFVKQFATFDVPLHDFFANQLRFARKIFTDTTWDQWLTIQKRNISIRRDDTVSKWRAGFQQVLDEWNQIEASREEFLGRRLRDEFSYSAYFGIGWPRRPDVGC